MTMAPNRRQLLRGFGLGAGSLLLGPTLSRIAAEGAGVPREGFPQRFVFVMKSSGILPESLVPPGLAPELEDDARFVDAPLAGFALPPTLAPLEPYKERLAIVQGLSGRMCRPGHSSWFGALGVYKTGGEHNSGVILRATLDAELARLFPSPFQHVGLAVRGKVMGTETEGTLYPGITAVGPNRELPFQASPDVAYQDLFGSAVAGDPTARTRYELQSNLLDFLSEDLRRLDRQLPGTEREKMGHLTHALEELQLRRERLAGMSDAIRAAAPERDERFDSKTPEVRQEAHFDLIAGALISGITNVVTLRLDNISTTYAQLGLGEKNVHGIGHQETCNGKTPLEARDLIRAHHMRLLARLAAQLDAVPEGDGTLLDNTAIVYMSDSGNEHHGNLRSWPYLVLGGCGGRLRLPGRYLQFPRYGLTGHRTIGNWYTSWLNAYGNRIEHYGNPDLELAKSGVPQTGPIPELA